MRIYMKKEAEFLDKVRELAKDNNMSATAKALKLPIYKLKARLLDVVTELGEVPPKFSKTRVRKNLVGPKKRKYQDTIRSSGKAGSAMRVIIPQRIFKELGWKTGDKILVRRSGKSKVIIEKPEN